MIKVDENDPVGELQPSFPYRDVVIKRNVDVNEYYELESEIGRGKFGTVYRCKEKSTGLTLAAKFVGIARRQDRRNVEREVEIMRTLQHPRLIQLYDAFEANSVMCVIQELIEGGELFERVIDDDFILTEKACTVFMRQICEGVEFIHSQNILHLDLKPENILCLTRTGNRIKIIDFGLARKFEPDKKLQVLFGTPEFVAPEVVNFEQIGFGTDMWSVGVICYVLLSGLSPFMGETDVETMANVTIAQYDFDDEAFDDISTDAKDFISKLLMKSKENRLTASECLSHIWLRRKPPPPPPPQIRAKENVELIPQPTQLEILDNTKENLREFVDRWTEQGSTSPSKVISLPTSEPFKEVNDNNVVLPPVVCDIKKYLIRDEPKILPDNATARTDVVNNVPINTDRQSLTDRLNGVRKDNVIADATQNNDENEIPGKKLKLDTSVSYDINNSAFNDNKIPSITELPTDNRPLSHRLLYNESNLSTKSDSTSGSKINVNVTDKNIGSSQSPTKSQPSSPIGTIPKTPSGSKLKSVVSVNETDDKSKDPVSPVSVKTPAPVEISTGVGTIRKTPSNEKIYPGVMYTKKDTSMNPNSEINVTTNVLNCSQIVNPLNVSKTPYNEKMYPGVMYTRKDTTTNANTEINKKVNAPTNVINSSQIVNLPSISKTPSNEKLYPGVMYTRKDTTANSNTDINKKINAPTNLTNCSQIVNPPKQETIPSSAIEPKQNKSVPQNSVIDNRSSESINPKPSHLANVIGSKSNESVHKPPQIPHGNLGVHKPKLVSQFSVPNDLSKCTLNKNVPATDKHKDINVNKITQENTTRTDFNRNNSNNVETRELTPSDGKFNKSLNKHVIPPKIHGIVLGQNDSQENVDSSSLAEKKQPKVITHKIFVEGRSEPILPAAVPSSINKENKKIDNRTQKPISKSQTSTKLELKENSDAVKNRPINSKFFDNDRFDRRGSDISCFLHNTENLERINLADEIKKLSSRLFQMGNAADDQQPNNVVNDPIPISSFRNDPIGRFLANHGVVTRRPKYRVSHLNRDVPIGSPPPASNLFYHLSHSNSDNWLDNQTHSAPQSPSASPEREIPNLTKEVILRLFDKNNPNNSTSPPKEQEKHSAMSSIDSLASYFKSNNDTKKNVPPFVNSK